MKLLECYIENFGSLSGVSHSFTDGLNSTYAENGAGKTTFTVFIKSMLYGLNTDRKVSLDENDRKKYLPWQGGRYGGSLTFEEGGKRYRIERSFGSTAQDDEFRLYDLERGTVSADYTENLGYEIFDIDAQGFLRTVFLSEKNVEGAIKNDSIAAKLSDLAGTTGDAGEVSRALDKLEERRKFYEKRGNQGEIPTLRAKISECETALVNLEAARQQLDKKEDELTALEGRIAELEKRRSEIDERLHGERIKAARMGYAQQYADMLASLERERKSFSELKEFFASGVPTDLEINEAYDAHATAKKLEAQRRDGQSPELLELKEYFVSPTDFGEIEAIKHDLKERNDSVLEADIIRKNRIFANETLQDELSGRIPTSDELRKHTETLAKTNVSPLGVIALVLAVIGASVCAVLGEYIIAAIVGVIGVVFALIAFVSSVGVKKEANAFCDSIGIKSDKAKRLSELTARIEDHERSVKADEERIELLEGRISTLSERISSFVARYEKDAVDDAQAIERIEQAFRKLYKLSTEAKLNEEGRRDVDFRISFFADKARQFLEKYKTSEPDPFDEIRRRLNSYRYAEMSLTRHEEEARRFKEQHAISDAELSVRGASEIPMLEEALGKLDSEILEQRRMDAVLKRDYNELLADVERIDEVSSMKDALKDRLSEYEGNLEAIKLTHELLKEASEAMTSRYIGGTKERFDHYVKLLGTDGDFSLSTTFLLTKHDRGVMRNHESYSRGTRDLYSFCLRLALSDSLFGGALPLVILDDPFTNLDSDKLVYAKELIRSIAKEKQVLYYTCSKERMIGES
ncbi:MAG: AAA family ATPase [Clostridia bacterium]|nr:AAA family ATPase [Clostridia bacterium]